MLWQYKDLTSPSTQYQEKRKITLELGASLMPPKEQDNVEYFAARPSKLPLPALEQPSGHDVYITFAVVDTGCGLNEEEIQRLFMRFSQASPRTHVQYGVRMKPCHAIKLPQLTHRFLGKRPWPFHMQGDCRALRWPYRSKVSTRQRQRFQVLPPSQTRPSRSKDHSSPPTPQTRNCTGPVHRSARSSHRVSREDLE